MAKDDGGPAFPTQQKTGIAFAGDDRLLHAETLAQGGMSLRDWFAGMAPAPTQDEIGDQMRLDQARNPHNDPHKPRLRDKCEIIAFLRYRHADAMLLARKETPND